MVSPLCQVKEGAGAYASTTNGVNVTPSATITIHLIDTSADSWSISCASTDELSVAADVTAALTINTTLKTATFTAPAAGSVYRFRSVVNGGVDSQGVVRSSYSTTFCVYTLSSTGNRAIAADETTEGNSTFGWLTAVNAVVRTPAGSTTALSLSPVDGALTCSSTAALGETHGFRFFNYAERTVLGVRVFTGASGNTKSFKVQLWDAAGSSLASATAVSSSNNEDLSILFSSPVVIGGLTSATNYYQISTYTAGYCVYLTGACGSNFPPSTGLPFLIAPNVLFKTWSYNAGDGCPTNAITSECYAIEPIFA